jgi:hypothetical protein
MRQSSNILEGAQTKENESTVLRRDEATGGWRKLHNEERLIPVIFRKIK